MINWSLCIAGLMCNNAFSRNTWNIVVKLATFTSNKQQTPWPLVRDWNIATEQPPLVDEI
jgi:hypothetical protein